MTNVGGMENTLLSWFYIIKTFFLATVSLQVFLGLLADTVFFSEEPLRTQDSATMAKMFGNINKTKELYPSGCDLPTYRGFLKLFVY